MERRRYPRVTMRRPIELKPFDEPAGPFSATLTRDASEGGVRIISEKFMAKNKRLLARFFLEDAGEVVSALSQIAWIGQVPYADRYQCGLEFLDMEPQGREALRSSVARRMKEKT